jgi:hypothetical protein
MLGRLNLILGVGSASPVRGTAWGAGGSELIAAWKRDIGRATASSRPILSPPPCKKPDIQRRAP